jgi:hypothetical protein
MNFFFLILALFQFAPAPECPVDTRAIAKCDIAYIGDVGSCVFESGEDLIYISTMGYTNGEISYITYYIAPDRNTEIAAVYVKAGNDSSSLYLYNPLERAESPPKELYIATDGLQAISHVTWCSPNIPTIITLGEFEATNNMPPVVALIAAVVVVTGLLLLWHGSKKPTIERTGKLK